MKRPAWVILVVVMLLLAAAAARVHGSLPFGDDDGGFVPPDKNTAKCEDAVAKKLAHFLSCVLICHVKAADKALAGKMFDEDMCENGPTKTGSSCLEKYEAAADRVLKKATCPACLDATAMMSLTSQGETFLDNLNGAIYCGGAPTATPTPLPTSTPVPTNTPGCVAACTAGQRCVNGTCVCDGTSCPTGCCSGATCMTPSTTSCGTNGAACVACGTGADSCTGGVCKCGSGQACAAGQQCVGGVCVCNSTSCPSGCCSGTICMTPSTTSCGTNGAACVACGTGADSCTGGVCKCGSGAACAPGQQCLNGACA